MTSRPRSAVDQVADVVFYGPLGLVLDGRKLMPELAKRGRRQIAFTRTIGKYAVKRGRARLDEAVGGLLDVLPVPDLGGPPASPSPGPSGNGSHPGPAVVEALGPDAGAPDEPPAPASSTDVDAIIDSYDSLSAVQVLPRLEGLSEEDLATVRDHEASTRARRTILAKITQLLP